MDNRFTEQDSIRIAEESRDRITGEIEPEEKTADCLTVCPLLTAGAMANPNYKRGGVACLGNSCAFWDLDSPTDAQDCLIYKMGFNSELIAEYMHDLYKMLRNRL